MTLTLTLTPTDRTERVEGTLCRLWEGATDAGIPVRAWIAIVQPQTHDPDRSARGVRPRAPRDAVPARTRVDRSQDGGVMSGPVCPAACLSCRHYDTKPGLAKDLDEHYGICRWPAPALPQIGIMRADVQRSLASIASRMIPKRGLEIRPELWSDCPTHEPLARAEREVPRGV